MTNAKHDLQVPERCVPLAHRCVFLPSLQVFCCTLAEMLPKLPKSRKLLPVPGPRLSDATTVNSPGPHKGLDMSQTLGEPQNTLTAPISVLRDWRIQGSDRDRMSFAFLKWLKHLFRKAKTWALSCIVCSTQSSSGSEVSTPLCRKTQLVWAVPLLRWLPAFPCQTKRLIP